MAAQAVQDSPGRGSRILLRLAVIGAGHMGRLHAAKFAARPGFGAIAAVRSDRLHEIKSPLILQPGPAALTDGLAALEAIIAP